MLNLFVVHNNGPEIEHVLLVLPHMNEGTNFIRKPTLL